MVRGVKATNRPLQCRQYDYSDANTQNCADLANYIVWWPTLPITSYPDKARELTREMNSKYRLPNSHWDLEFRYDGKDIVIPSWSSGFGLNQRFLNKIVELLQEQKKQGGPTVVAFSTEILPGMNDTFPYVGGSEDLSHSKDHVFYKVGLGSRPNPQSLAKELRVFHFVHKHEADPTRCYFMCRLDKKYSNAAESPNQEKRVQQLETEKKMVEDQRIRRQLVPVAWNHPQTQSQHLPCLPGAPARALLRPPCSPSPELQHHSTPYTAVEPAVPPSQLEPVVGAQSVQPSPETPAPAERAEGGLLDLSMLAPSEGDLLESPSFHQGGEGGEGAYVGDEDPFQEREEEGDSTPPLQTSSSWDSSDEVQLEWTGEWDEQYQTYDPLFSG